MTLLAPFISNPEGSVYAVTNLPEEFVAVLFAWVSRSSKSFKEHLLQAIKDGHIDMNKYKDANAFEQLTEKASAFHEKWTVGYGHSSVAEHAITHVGIEKVSRLASAELELSNEFYSITEYSQRYQKPVLGGWYNPYGTEAEAGDTDDWMIYETFMHRSYIVFEQLIEGVKRHFMAQEDKQLQAMSPKQYERRMAAIEKLAFEDARYALPLAMHTQLGMTANGRAWRDGLVNLYSSDYRETRQLADDLKNEITKVLPTLLKYANPSQYQINSKKRNKAFFNGAKGQGEGQAARLISFPDERAGLNTLLALVYVEQYGIPFNEALARAGTMSDENMKKFMDGMMFEFGKFDNPPEAFKQLDYRAELLISEANWHQLLRHNRKTNFIFNEPTPYQGITIPPRIREAGLEDLLILHANLAESMFKGMEADIAPYVVLNAHRRRIVAHFDLWEAYHLINLRTSEEAQWDIRQTFTDLYNQLMFVNPNLIQYAKRR
ncbi:Thymidylate synthase ThyX [Paenibacillus sp. UNC496MF]|nr:Thymidylate synthase ThyX [Paenibacillus sp. UNC496MF]